MASDGAIIVDTGIDNKGFKRGAREFTNAVQGLKNAVDQTGKAMADSTNSYMQAMNRARSAAKGLTGDQRSITREIAKTEAALGKLNDKQEKMRALADQRAQEQRDQLREQMIEETKAAIGHGNWEIMPKWSQDQAIEQTMRDFEGRLAAIQSEPIENTDGWRSLQYDIDLATAKLEGLRSNLAELSGEAQTEVAPAIEEAVTEPVQVANEELQKYARLMGDWSATMQEDSWNETPVNDESAMLSISRYINTLIEQRNEAYHDTIARIEEAAAAANEENTAAQQTTEAVRNTASANTEAAQAAHETARAEENVAQSAQRAQSAFQRGAQDAISHWNQMPTVMRSVGQYLTAIGTAATHPAQALDRLAYTGIRGFVKLAGAAARATANVAKMAGGGALSFLRKLAAGAKNAAIQLAKLAGSAIKGGMKKLGGMIGGAAKSLFGFNRAQSMADGGLKRGFMTILKYGLGIRGLFALFRKLRSAVADGLGEIEKRNPKAKAAIDGLKRSLNALKGSLGSAFAPVVTAVAPALTKLINMLTSAINTIGAFIAALTGQSSYQKAVSGLKATGSAASGAAGEVEKLNRQLAGFDELNVLNSKDSGGGGGGGGGSGLSYTTEEISGGITDFVNKLKELWANADYEGIGREIAGAINNAFAKAKELISWDNLGEKITEVVNGITGIINGLVDGIDWDLIGSTFGEGINTLVKTANQLLTKINWEAIGNGFATGLNGLVDTVNWDELGQMFGNKMNAIIAVIRTTVTGFDWSYAGTAFANLMNNLLSTVNWESLYTAATNSINGIISALRVAVNSFDWSYAATSFSNTVNGLLTGIDWDALADTASTGINKIVSALRIAVNSFDWSYAATAFTNTVNGLLTGVDWENIAKLATDSINKVTAALRIAVNGFKWDYAATAFVNTVNGLLTGIDWDAMVETATTGINKIISALRVAVNGFNWSYAATSFSNTIEGLMKGIDWDGLAETATTGANKIVSALRLTINSFDWGYAGTSFVSTVNSLISGFDWENLGHLVQDGIAKPLSVLRIAVSQFDFSYAASSFAASVNAFFDNPQLWKDAGTIVSDAIKGLFTWGTDFLNNLDTAQIAADIKAALGAIDWPGIGKAIFDFLVAAIKAAGNLIWELLTDFPDEGQVEQEIKEWKDGVVGDSHVDLVFGLNPMFEDEAEIIRQINEAISAGLETGNFTFPVGLDVSKETVLAAATTFVQMWNNLHPEAPLTVNAETGEVEPLAQKIIDAEDKSVTTKENLVNGKQDASALKTRDDKDSTVTHKEDLAIGKEDKSAIKTRDATNKTVTTTEGLAKNTKNWNSDADKALNASDTSATLTQSVKKGTTFNTDAFAAAKKGAGDTLRNLKQSVSQGGTFNKDAFAAAKKGAGDTLRNLKQSVSQGGTFNKDAFAAAKKGAGDTLRELKQSVSQGGTFNKDAFAAAKKSAGATLRNLKQSVTKGSWKGDAYTAAKKGGGKTSRTLEQTVKQGKWNGSAYTAALIRGGTIKKTIEVGLKLASGALAGLKKLLGLQSGGVFINGVWRSIPQYAGGTLRAGSIFAAGERGPELVGHIGGRTEVLNKSQLASTMFSAVENGMLSAISRLHFRTPAMATGSVLPYDVSAQIAKTGDDIMGTLNANNEDLIQTIISVAGQLVAAVQNTNRNSVQSGGLPVDEMIRQINQRTQMLGRSPLLG